MSMTPAKYNAQVIDEFAQPGNARQCCLEPWDAFCGQRYAEVEDPDGNVVDLFAPL
jgi:hypothetical protein